MVWVFAGLGAPMMLDQGNNTKNIQARYTFGAFRIKQKQQHKTVMHLAVRGSQNLANLRFCDSYNVLNQQSPNTLRLSGLFLSFCMVWLFAGLGDPMVLDEGKKTNNN